MAKNKRNKCIAVLADGIKCTKAAMLGKDYCESHIKKLWRFSNFFRNKWYMPPLIGILTILSFAFTVYFGYLSATKKDIEGVNQRIATFHNDYIRRSQHDPPPPDTADITSNAVLKSLLNNAFDLRKKNNILGAKEILLKAERAGVSWYTSFLLGRTEYDLKNYHEAVRYYRESENRHINTLKTNKEYSRLTKDEILTVLIKKANNPKVKDATIYIVDPQLSLIYDNLGSALLEVGLLSEAERILMIANEIFKKDPIATVNLGAVYLNQDKLKEAENLFRQAISLDPKDPTAYINMGLLKKKQSNLPEAKYYFQLASQIAPSFSKGWSGMGEIALSEKRYKEAINLFQKACELEDRDASSYNNMGIAFSKLGRYKEAINAQEKSVNIDSRNPAYWINLGFSYFDGRHLDSGYVDKSMHAMKNALSIDPALPQAYLGMGNISYLQGRFDAAVEYYKKFMDLSLETKCCEEARPIVQRQLKELQGRKKAAFL
jgi:tetratricopeptide (TPR) repeat protein